MSIKQTIDIIEQRLEELQAIPADKRNDFIDGSVNELVWCRDQIKQGASTIFSPDDDEDDDDDIDGGSFYGVSSVSLIRSARQAVQRCIPHHDHAYLLHSPQRNYKECKHCHDIQVMGHGEKISYGRHNNRKGTEKVAATR